MYEKVLFNRMVLLFSLFLHIHPYVRLLYTVLIHLSTYAIQYGSHFPCSLHLHSYVVTIWTVGLLAAGNREAPESCEKLLLMLFYV